MHGAGVASTDFPLRLKVLGLMLCCAPLSLFLILDFDSLAVIGYGTLSLLLSLLAAAALEVRSGGFSPRRFVMRLCACMTLVIVIVLAYEPVLSSALGALRENFGCIFCGR